MTGTEIIKSAMRVAGILATGETPSADELADGASALNRLLDKWNTERLTVYATTRTTKTLTASDGDYSIGASGDINVTQPLRIEEAAIIAAGNTLETPIKVLTQQEWSRLADKTSTGTPRGVYFQKGIASARGTIFTYPLPDAAHTLILYLHTQLTQISVVASDYALPPGYLDAIVNNLAVKLASEYGAPLRPDVVAQAVESKAAIQSLNIEPMLMDADPLSGGTTMDITTGGYR